MRLPSSASNLLEAQEAYRRLKADRKTNLNYQQWVWVRSTIFKGWFGDWDAARAGCRLYGKVSKIVGDDGEPLVLYHGTNADVRSFDRERIGEASGNNGFLGAAFYLSADPEIASAYADDTGGNVMPLFVCLTNPLRIDRKLSSSTAQAINVALSIATFRGGMCCSQVKDGLSISFIAYPDLAETFAFNLIAAGYDGVIFDRHHEVAVFNADKMKSAIGSWL